ncbi:MAG: hypothetical protein ACR2RV_23030, partial [Verrucomicrobiales bacterium]
LWVTGLILLAPVLAGTALALRAPGREAWLIVMMCAGLVSALLGYVGSWLALRAMQRDEISSAWRTWLRLIVVALPCGLIALLASIFAATELKYFGKGSVFLVMIAGAVPTYMMAVVLSKNAGFSVMSYQARQWAWRGIALLMVGISLWAASVDGLWPFAHSKLRAVITLPSLGERGLGTPITEAVGERMEDYDVRWYGDRVTITVLHETRPVVRGGAPMERLISNLSPRIEPVGESETPQGHIRAFYQRLLDALPAKAIVGAKIQYIHFRAPVEEQLLIFGLLAALAAMAMGLGLMGPVAGLLGICSLVFAYILMLFVPTRGYPEGRPQLVGGAALGDLEPAPIVADFSSPAAAARTYVEAMSRSDLELIERAVSPGEFERMTAHLDPTATGLRPEISGFEGGRVLSVDRHRVSNPNKISGVGMKVKMISRDATRQPVFDGWFTESPDGSWKLGTYP